MNREHRSICLALIGFSVFFVIEQFLHYHPLSPRWNRLKKPFGYLILFGDAIHTFVGWACSEQCFLGRYSFGSDGLVSEALHEIPHKLGDFGSLLYSGWDRKKALG